MRRTKFKRGEIYDWNFLVLSLYLELVERFPRQSERRKAGRSPAVESIYIADIALIFLALNLFVTQQSLKQVTLDYSVQRPRLEACPLAI